MEKNGIFDVHPWKIIEANFDIANSEKAESIFSLSNEYMGTRGMFEESLQKGPTLEGCYIGGIYTKEKQEYIWKRNCFPNYANSIINTTNWLSIQIEVDGELFSTTESDFLGYNRQLDMRSGLLERQLIFRTKSQAETWLRWERFISHHDRHFAAIQLSITALNHQKPIRITLALNGKKENRDRANAFIHCEAVNQAAGPDDVSLLMKVKETGQFYIHRMSVDSHDIIKQAKEYKVDNRTVDYSFSFIPQKGIRYNIEKFVSVWTSRDFGYPYGVIEKENDSLDIDHKQEQTITEFLKRKSSEHICDCLEQGYDVLRSNHIERVVANWDNLDIDIVGEESAQQGIRYCMFQLFSTYRGNDGFINIAPKGYTGENYEGRYFWDSESYCFPFYLLTNPLAARKLMEYRYNTLDAARCRAKEFGYSGAMYPMTTIDGTEDCSVWEYSIFEIHISCTIAYVIYLYDHITDDKDYLYTKGIEVLIEIARFWASRVTYIPYRNGYGINRVTGPDEWQQFVNNNFYTNYMAKWVLDYTTQIIGEMQSCALEKLEAVVEKTKFDFEEIKQWQKISEQMILTHDKELNIYVQDDMFLSLDPAFREELDVEKDLPIDRKWTLDKIARSQLLKQPDVLLAMFLFRDRFSIEEKKKNYEFYEQRTVHGSSLSPCIHSILANEIEKYNQGYEYYLWASRLDLDDYNHNTHEGIHISSMAGSWLAIVCGFGGMVYTGELIEFAPILPPAWSKYSFRVTYRGNIIKVSVSKTGVTLQIISGKSIKARVYGKDVQITKNEYTVELLPKFVNRPALKAVIFDLDGVVVDTAKYHYQAWREIALSEGIYFDEKINERLKGVSRMESLNIILERSKKIYSEKELQNLAEKKNSIYVEMLKSLNPECILPGIKEFLKELRSSDIKIALFSVSKNTLLILKSLGIEELFDVVVTGNDILKSKPDPEGFLLAAQKLGCAEGACVVIEDAFAGTEAAIRAGMKSIGIGQKDVLHNADYVLPLTKYLNLEMIQMLF